MSAEEQGSIANFRQFGDYKSSYGGRVVAERLYRSGELSQATAAERSNLIDINFSLVADLRYPSERLARPSPWPDSWVSRVVSHEQDRDQEAPHLKLLRTPGTPVSAVEVFYTDLYSTLPLRPPYLALFGQLLQRIATTDGPLLVHCTAGKDRTGMFVALFHTILGVSYEDIQSDYLQSLQAPGLSDTGPSLVSRIEIRYGHRPSLELAERLLAVRREYLDHMFASIDRHYGSLGSYLGRIGVTDDVQATIRERFLV